ncbi:hypothetical protein EWE75_15695 [Sphingomonas populi]|uniref:Uncharacterized protein n=1 Tax=Sphingomonas populi TaxID=2484750 RepID=A0A4Q6Y312_9SPHN|nr:hypothetical protein [Sphingomonas populi]RZF63486.1 hypothetical protein EWE75_15695 [Sphingomonas populi]
MGLFAALREAFQPVPEDHSYQPPWRWRTIDTAPEDEYLLLGWKTEPDNPEGYSHIIAAGYVRDGTWLDGPAPPPDFYMEELPYHSRRPMSEAPNGMVIIVGWDIREGNTLTYDFEVTTLEEGHSIDGFAQPDWWMDGPRLPRA